MCVVDFSAREMFNFLKCILLIQICFAMEVLKENTGTGTASETQCTLPPSIQNGKYIIDGSTDPIEPTPGQLVDSKTLLLYRCNDGYYSEFSAPKSICFEGGWITLFQGCRKVFSCSTISNDTSGVYAIQPPSAPNKFEVYCDLNLIGKKWTVIQQRVDASVEFNNSYDVYKRGFGDLTGSHWLGLDNIHWITKDGDYELYIDLESFNGERTYARYSTFKVGDSNSGYRLTVNGFSGNTGNNLKKNNGRRFTTRDVDQDKWIYGNCAELFSGGWWFEDCGSSSNLNGRYKTLPDDRDNFDYWFDHFKETIIHKTVRMLITKKF